MKRRITVTRQFHRAVDRLIKARKLEEESYGLFKKDLVEYPTRKGKKKNRFFEELKEGLEDVLAYKKGKITLKSEEIDIPEPPISYKAKDVKRIRSRHNYSQSIFARVLNVSTKTVQSWESGDRIPSHAALRLLEIIDMGIYPSSKRKTEKRL